ncbi:MAG: TetR/AcrR family transcriptional regulator [Micromonosporaceae bacterium]
MGNRDALLEGAKRCFREKGYARTTARDIAQASGVSLAAIGYHFGSKEALMNLALFESVGEWGEQLAGRLARIDPVADPTQRFERVWQTVIASLEGERTFWAANFEIFAQVEHSPEIRDFFADAMQKARLGLAALLGGIDPEADPEQAAQVGSFYYALLIGVVGQWLVDPEHAPSGAALASALRVAATGVPAETATG